MLSLNFLWFLVLWHGSDCTIVDCSAVSCLTPVCNKGEVLVTPTGKCCPICQIDCSAVSCLTPVCNKGEVLVTPTGKCCPICQIDCSAVSCLIPVCNKGEVLVTPTGKCCPICQIDCSAVSCLTPVCNKGEVLVTPTGKCCPICQTDCSAVSCLTPVCNKGEVLVTPTGKCCPICQIDCSAVSCLTPVCNKGEVLVTPTGKCCPICKIDCSAVSCLTPVCNKGEVLVTPTGKCCPICQSQVDCRLVKCLAVVCQLPQIGLVPPGKCCPVCTDPPVDCRKVLCPLVRCLPGYVTVTPKGQCCPKCQLDCSDVSCLRPVCTSEEILVTPPGQCCPKCQVKQDCRLVKCATVLACTFPYTSTIPPGQCCAECPDCRNVVCAVPLCQLPYKPSTPAGECCPVCPDCSNAVCEDVDCPNADVAPGECCPKCPDCTSVQCKPVSCRVSPIAPPGQCCPICPASCEEKDGTVHAHGEKWQRDPCTFCQCYNGRVICAQVACALPTCANPVQLPDKCCPVCDAPCREKDGTVYKHGDTWDRDPCTFCNCDNGEVICASIACALPNCDNPVTLPDTCCPVCDAPCIDDNGLSHQHGDNWKVSDCEGCMCDNGKIQCYVQDCAAPQCENYIKVPGICCPICPEPCGKGIYKGECKPEPMCKKPNKCRHRCPLIPCDQTLKGHNLVCCMEKKPPVDICFSKPGKCPKKGKAICHIAKMCVADSDCPRKEKCCGGCCKPPVSVECEYTDNAGNEYAGECKLPEQCKRPEVSCPAITCPVPWQKCSCCFKKGKAPPKKDCKKGRPPIVCVVRSGKKKWKGECKDLKDCKKVNSCPLYAGCPGNKVCCFKKKKPPTKLCFP